MRVVLLAAAILALTGSVRAADPIAFEADGMRLGHKLTEEYAYSHCPARDKGKPDRTCSKRVELGDKHMYMLFHFYDWTLVSVSLSFDPSLFSTVVAAYTDKFGQTPHKTYTEQMKTRMGASYTNDIVQWTTDSGIFKIEKYGSSVDMGYGALESKEWAEALKKQERVRSGDLSKKL